MNAELQRTVRRALVRMTPEELEQLGLSFLRASAEMKYVSEQALETIDRISIIISARE